MKSSQPGPVLTLEPLIDAVRVGVEAAGWQMSGLQKTTSYQFEGRWKDEQTRSAFLLFHHPSRWDGAGIDAYLDESLHAVDASLSLVVDAPPLQELGPVAEALGRLASAVASSLPTEYDTPVTLRVRLARPSAEPALAHADIRFKLRIPPTVLEAGAQAVTELVTVAVGSFEALLADPRIAGLVSLD
jgi:hypothetical protein